MIEHGVVQLIPEEPAKPLAETEAEVRSNWSTKQIKKLMAELGVDSTRCFEKSELVDELVSSGRVVFGVAAAETKEDDARRDETKDAETMDVS